MQKSKKVGIVTHWEAAVVEENISLLELAKLSLLLILLDGIADLIGRNLVLFPVGGLMIKEMNTAHEWDEKNSTSVSFSTSQQEDTCTIIKNMCSVWA